MVKLRFPSAALAANEHKNPDFVLEKPENEGSEGQKSTKTLILCSKWPKIGVPDPKSAQKWRFCALEEGEWHRKHGEWHPETCREGQLSFDFRPSGN